MVLPITRFYTGTDKLTAVERRWRYNFGGHSRRGRLRGTRLLDDPFPHRLRTDSGGDARLSAIVPTGTGRVSAEAVFAAEGQVFC